jgi:uncharacterized protein YbaR (Trm112 family)
VAVNKEDLSTSELLCCPICFEPLIRKGPAGLNMAAVSRSAFSCARCRRSYSTRDVYLDLTLLARAQEYQEIQASGTELFRSPWVSFAYERGWRQNFRRAGFPGPDEEVPALLLVILMGLAVSCSQFTWSICTFCCCFKLCL